MAPRGADLHAWNDANLQQDFPAAFEFAAHPVELERIVEKSGRVK